MAFVKNIEPNSYSSGTDGERLVHQSSPSYVITFIRWKDRDVYGANGNKAGISTLATEKTLVVENDATDIKIKNSKTGLTPSLDITLKNGDIDYASVLAPGDFVLVNLLDWEADARRVGDKARANEPINEYADGFKGVFKIQTAGKRVVVQSNGVKSVVFNVQAFGFTEFNNIIYYDPVAAATLKGKGKESYMWSNFGSYLSNFMNSEDPFSIQDLIRILFEVLIGNGELQDDNLSVSPNLHYFIPSLLGQLLGLDNAKFAAHLYKYYLGVWPNSKSTNDARIRKGKVAKQTPSEIGIGFNPGMTSTAPDSKGEKNDASADKENKKKTKSKSIWFKTKTKIQGQRLLAPDYWNKIKVWAIVKSYLNSTINEMYTANRVSVDGRIYPSVVVRQKPFNSIEREKSFIAFNAPYTKYLSLPRWKVSPALLYSSFLGKNEASRINYVQVFTQSLAINKHSNYALQSAHNTVIDKEDIKRTGVRPFTAMSNFNFPELVKSKDKAQSIEKSSKVWSSLVADWLFNGHLREVGSFEFHGIVDPIEVGDNLEFDGSVYHIENISHRYSVRVDGQKTFRTNISVSYGTSLKSNSEKTVYPHTESTTYTQEQNRDFREEKLLPGVSDTQDVVGRKGGIK